MKERVFSLFDRVKSVLLDNYRLNREFKNKTSDLKKNGCPHKELIRLVGLGVANKDKSI